MNNPSSVQAPPVQVDGEHKVQLKLLSALEAAVDGKRGVDRLDEILDHYISYSELHFMSEQLLMRLYAYPGYDDHIAAHDELIDRMREIRRCHEDGDDAGLHSAVAAQKSALLDHLREHDREFDAFLHDTTGN